jgi:cobalt-precorrin-6B (C15)-methyltransferase
MMSPSKLPGGPTQDEVMAVALFKLGLRDGVSMIDVGCGTGKVSIAAAKTGANVVAIDRRPEAIRFAKKESAREGVKNIRFFCTEATEFLADDDRTFDCAFVGGSHGLFEFLPVLATRVRRRIVVNAVLVSTLQTAVTKMQELGIFDEVVQVQIARSHAIAGSIMFRPIDPVYVIVGTGAAC